MDAYTNWRGEAGGQNKPGIGSYLDQLMAAGVISPDRIYNTQDGNTLYLGNDGNIYFPTYAQTWSGSGQNMALDPIDYSKPMRVERIPLSNIDPATGKDKLNAVSDFLDPNTGQMYDQGKAGFNQMRPDEMLTLAMIAAMTGGAAYAGLTGAGAAAGGGGGGWMAGVDGAALAGPEVAGMTGAEIAGAGGAGSLGSGGLSSVEGAFEMLGPEAFSGVEPLAGMPPPVNPFSSGPGVPPPANPFSAQSYLNPQNLSNLATSGGLTSWLGPASTILGAASGAKGQQDSATQTQQLPGFLQKPVAEDLIPKTQGLLASQGPAAALAGASMMQTGQGLLSRPVAGNGFDQVNLEMPTTAQNPYLSGMADDIGRRTQEMLGQNNLAIQGNAVGVGGLGGSRQGVAQGIAAGKAADYLQGNLAGLYGNAWNQDANRALTKYTADQGFYGQQRQQDLAQTSMGAGLLSTGVDTAWQPLKNAASIYGNFSPYGSKTTTTEQGGGWQGLLGGALAGASLGSKAGWW